jgi:drug/metabolite transporter (DMT)-like permease
MTNATLGFVLSFTTAAAGTLLYHLAARNMPAQANPAMSLIVVYLIGSLLSAAALLVLLRPPAGTAVLAGLGWPTAALGLAVVLIEFGFLWMYRSGWGVSTGGLAVNIAATVALVAVGLLFFGERLTPANWFGAAICLVGLVLLTYRPAAG